MIPKTICMLGSGVGSMMHIHGRPFHEQQPSLQVASHLLVEAALLIIYASCAFARSFCSKKCNWRRIRDDLEFALLASSLSSTKNQNAELFSVNFELPAGGSADCKMARLQRGGAMQKRTGHRSIYM